MHAKKIDLSRFLEAQNKMYLTAFNELSQGKKETHWMWFIFPQLRGLGSSENAVFYGIHDLTEATIYLEHPILGKHLEEMAALLLTYKHRAIETIFNELDTRKLRSSMTLFSQIPNACPLFQEIISVFFFGSNDPLTSDSITASTV
ncbi:DUF1810 domain-containing protein [Flavobacterium sp. TMP13]|uniref:DUF1810 domain-containing protein n=1 Tax=Flavobacterium sp. TMP13 TaxID=3425950 RepID=UPI003D77F798